MPNFWANLASFSLGQVAPEQAAEAQRRELIAEELEQRDVVRRGALHPPEHVVASYKLG